MFLYTSQYNDRNYFEYVKTINSGKDTLNLLNVNYLEVCKRCKEYKWTEGLVDSRHQDGVIIIKDITR